MVWKVPEQVKEGRWNLTPDQVFDCEGLLRSQYTKNCIWKKYCAPATEAWEVFSVYFLLLAIWLEKQVVTTLRFWIMSKGYDSFTDVKPTSTTIPRCTISQYHWFPLVQARLCLQAGLQLPEPCEWEGQQRSCRTTTIWWKCWCRNVTLGQFLDLFPGAFPAEAVEIPTLHCSPAGPPSSRDWDVTSRNKCRLLTTPSHTPLSFQHESKQSYFFKPWRNNTCILLALHSTFNKDG